MPNVKIAANSIGSKTIENDWPSGLSAYDDQGATSGGIKFNGAWMDLQMQQGTTIFDLGPLNGGISPYYNLETARLFFNDYPNVYYLKKLYNNIYYYHR